MTKSAKRAFDTFCGWVGAKRPLSVKSVTHIHEPWHSYTLPKEDPKDIWITWHTPWVLLTSAFFIGNQQTLLYQEIQKYIISNPFNFSWIFKDLLINVVIILMMSAKMATSGFLRITIFWNKSYDVKILVLDVTNRILSRDSNYIVDMVIWPKFVDHSSISMREVITTSIL